MELIEVKDKAKELGLTVKTIETTISGYACVFAHIYDDRSDWNNTVDAYQVDDDVCIDFLNRKDDLFYFIDNRTVYLNDVMVNNLRYDKEEKRLAGKYTNLHREELINKIAEIELKLNNVNHEISKIVKQEISKVVNDKGY